MVDSSSKINNWDRDKYLDAWYFASTQHNGQKYGGHLQGQQIEYLTHIGKVAMEIIWALSNTDIAYDADLAVQCAILHDTVEDTSATYDELNAKFGKKVADGVMALSKNELLPSKAEQMEDSLSRIKLQPKEIWMVKMADRISNLYRPPFYWDNVKMTNYLKEAETIHTSLNEANIELAKRLIEKIQNYNKYIQQ